MFDNIGGKIKALAQVVCWAGIICSVFAGIVMAAYSEGLAFFGVVVMVVGSLLSWVSSFVLYGFGQLIENTDPSAHSSKESSMKKTNIPDKNPQKNEQVVINEKTPEQAPLSNDFIEEIKNTNTADLRLILDDQKDLYSSNEIAFIKNELSKR